MADHVYSKYGIRFENNEQAETFIYQMAEEVSRRLKSIDMQGRSITLRILTRDPSAPVEAPKVRLVDFLVFIGSFFATVSWTWYMRST